MVSVTIFISFVLYLKVLDGFRNDAVKVLTDHIKKTLAEAVAICKWLHENVCVYWLKVWCCLLYICGVVLDIFVTQTDDIHTLWKNM